MNKSLVLAAPLLALVAACAAPGGSATRTAAAAPASGTQYCVKDRLFESGAEMTCNWAPTSAGACDNTNLSSISKGSVSGAPANAGRCADGHGLVSVTKKG